MLFKNLPALVPLFMYYCATGVSAQNSVEALYNTGAWTEVQGCSVQTSFAPSGSDGTTWLFHSYVYLNEANPYGADQETSVDKPFTETINQYITGGEFEYGVSVSFKPDSNGDGTVNYQYAGWAGSAPMTAGGANIKFPCWIHGASRKN